MLWPSYAGLVKASREGMVGADETVVVVVPGNGLKDVTSAMQAAGQARRVEPSLEALKAILKA